MDREGFEEFATQSMPALGRYSYVLTGNTHDAQDLVQDALFRVFRAWSRVQQDGNPLAYTKQTMVRLHISGLRQLKRRLRGAPAETAVDDPGLSRVDNLDQLRGCLEGLSPLQRAVLVMSYLDDTDDDTIADLLHRKPATIRSLRGRGLAAVRLQEEQVSHGAL